MIINFFNDTHAHTHIWIKSPKRVQKNRDDKYKKNSS